MLKINRCANFYIVFCFVFKLVRNGDKCLIKHFLWGEGRWSSRRSEARGTGQGERGSVAKFVKPQQNSLKLHFIENFT